MLSIKKAIEGVVGLIDWKLGHNFANEDDIQKRMLTCIACELRIGKDTPKDITDPTQRKLLMLGNCSKCGCFLIPKVSLQGQKCPDNRW